MLIPENDTTDRHPTSPHAAETAAHTTATCHDGNITNIEATFQKKKPKKHSRHRNHDKHVAAHTAHGERAEEEEEGADEEVNHGAAVGSSVAHVVAQCKAYYSSLSQHVAHLERGKTTASQGRALEDAAVNPLTGRKHTNQYFSILADRRKLPIASRRDEFLRVLHENPIVVLVGETGSGKTTQIPQYVLWDMLPFLNGKIIGCTQPRRVAAMSVARRVAAELDTQLGQHVGYSIRFEDHTCPQRTALKYMTDGMLLREIQADKLLSRYDAIILDEAHERTVQTDILMGLLKDLCASGKRPEFKLIVMSATLDAAKFQKYFNHAPLLSVSGRTFPVEICYMAEPTPDYVETAVATALMIHRDHTRQGDILMFLTGEEEIETACRELKTRSLALQCSDKTGLIGELVVVPLYSSLPVAQQELVFMKVDKLVTTRLTPKQVSRKIVVATNIAETSITIDGVVFVIDPGFAKQKLYNPRLRGEYLQVTPISQAAARQRAGRAGRTCEGTCYRLYPESAYKELELQTYPEMLRCNLSSVILQMFNLDLPSIIHFDFMDPPAPETVMRALELLNNLGAVSDDAQLSEQGRMMADFPLDPELSKMLIESPRFGCSDEMLRIVAMLNVPNVFVRPKDRHFEADEARMQFMHKDGDHLALLHVYDAFVGRGEHESASAWCSRNFINARSMEAAVNVYHQLRRVMQRWNLLPSGSSSSSSAAFVSPHVADAALEQHHQYHVAAGPAIQRYSARFYEQLRRNICAGAFMHTAVVASTQDALRGGGIGKRRGTVKYTASADMSEAHLHPSSCLQSSERWVLYNEWVYTSRAYIRTAIAVKPEWIAELAPARFISEDCLRNRVALAELRAIAQRICPAARNDGNDGNDGNDQEFSNSNNNNNNNNNKRPRN